MEHHWTRENSSRDLPEAGLPREACATQMRILWLTCEVYLEGQPPKEHEAGDDFDREAKIP